MVMSSGQRIWIFLRLILGAMLFVWVLSTANWGEVMAHLHAADWRFVAVFLVITPLNVGVFVWKWQILLRAGRVTVPFWLLYRMYVVSQFYNNVLPSSVGGDVVRVAMLNRSIRSPERALASILVERFSGLTVLVILGVAATVATAELRANRMLLALVAGVDVTDYHRRN